MNDISTSHLLLENSISTVVASLVQCDYALAAFASSALLPLNLLVIKIFNLLPSKNSIYSYSEE